MVTSAATEYEGRRAKTHVARREAKSVGARQPHVHDHAHSYPGHLLNDHRLNNRGNAAMQVALMRQAQQTYGNRTVRRYLQRAARLAESGSKEQSAQPSIQRQPKGGTATAKPADAVVVKIDPIKRATYQITAKTLKEAVAQMEQRDEAGETGWKPAHN